MRVSALAVLSALLLCSCGRSGNGASGSGHSQAADPTRAELETIVSGYTVVLDATLDPHGRQAIQQGGTAGRLLPDSYSWYCNGDRQTVYVHFKGTEIDSPNSIKDGTPNRTVTLMGGAYPLYANESGWFTWATNNSLMHRTTLSYTDEYQRPRTVNCYAFGDNENNARETIELATPHIETADINDFQTATQFGTVTAHFAKFTVTLDPSHERIAVVPEPVSGEVRWYTRPDNHEVSIIDMKLLQMVSVAAN